MAASCQCYECKKARAELEFRETLRRSEERVNAMSPFAGYNARVLIGPSTYANVTDWRINADWPLSAYFPRIEEKPMTSSNTPTSESIVKDIRQLPEGTDLSDVSGALAATEERHRAAIEGALQGVVKLELIKGVQSKRFVLVYFRNGREYITSGIAYPGYSMDSEEAEKKIKGDTVWLNIGEDRWFRYQHKTMDALREHLRERKIPHRIAFFDE